MLPSEEYLQTADGKLDEELESCRLKTEKERGGFVLFIGEYNQTQKFSGADGGYRRYGT